jgi:hypothetical protein
VASTGRGPRTNPFVPGSDAVPEVWAGRAGELADFHHVVRARRLAGVYERGRIVLGPPGIGKSVLLNRIAAEAAALGDLVVRPIRFSAASAPVEGVVSAIRAAQHEHLRGEGVGARLTRALDRFTEITTAVGGVRLALPDNPAADLAAVLVEVGRLAAADERAVLLRLDEVQAPRDTAQLSAVLVAIADALAATEVRRDGAGNEHERVLPIIVYLSGLPTFWKRADEARTTFSRRIAPTVLRPVDDGDVRHALVPFTTDGWPVLGPGGAARVHMAQEAVALILDKVLGDPFLLQLLGRAAWDAGDSSTITGEDVASGWRAVSAEAERHVARLLDDVSPLERRFLEAMAQLGPSQRSLTGIAAALGRTASQVASVARRLDLDHGFVDRGTPYAFGHRTLEALLVGRWP